jgi:hypothetical protein
MASLTPSLSNLRATLKPLAVGLCVAQGAPLLHLAFAPHELCPRGDGEWIDSVSRGSSTNQAAPGVDRDASPAGQTSAHEHCALVGLLRAARLHSNAAFASAVPSAGSTTSAPPTSPPCSLSALEVAPKQSPPPLTQG